MTGTSNRDLSLDFMKGVLIYLVVFGHVIAKYADPGWAYTVIHTFHMPLFFFISGYLMVPSMKRSFGAFAGKKWIRILRPALLWSLLFLLLKLPSHLDFATKIIKSLMDIWFLYVLFYLYMVAWPMTKSKNRYLWYGLAVVAGYLIYPFLLKVPSRHFGYIVEEFRIIRELPVFLMGILYWEYKDKMKDWHKYLAVAIAAILYFLCFYPAQGRLDCKGHRLCRAEHAGHLCHQRPIHLHRAGHHRHRLPLRPAALALRRYPDGRAAGHRSIDEKDSFRPQVLSG